MLFLILLIYIFALSLNFNKAIIIWAPIRLFLIPGLLLLPEIQLYDVMSIVSFFFYARKKNLSQELRKFPLKRCFVLMILSGAILLCRDGIHIKSLVFQLSLPIDVFILYSVIKGERDMKTLYRSLSIFVVVMFADALLQLLLDVNPLSDFIDNNTSDTFYIADDSIYKELRGVRIRSFFPHSIGFGNVCSILAFVYCIIWMKYNEYKKAYLYLGILVASVILSGSRTPLLGMCFFVLGILLDRRVLSQKMMFFVLIGLSLLYFYGDMIMHMIVSMFNNDLDDMKGSSFEMRIEQLEGCFTVISSNIWFGIGLDFNLLDWNWLLKGNESVWFDILCQRGLFGCFCYVFIFVDVIIKSKNNCNQKLLLFLALGYFVEQSSTYNAGLNEYIYFLAFIVIYKLGELKNELQYEKPI